MYMVTDEETGGPGGNSDFDENGKMKPRPGHVRFTGPDAKIKYRQWRIANGFGGL
jgi:hypothetical protein